MNITKKYYWFFLLGIVLSLSGCGLFHDGKESYCDKSDCIKIPFADDLVVGFTIYQNSETYKYFYVGNDFFSYRKINHEDKILTLACGYFNKKEYSNFLELAMNLARNDNGKNASHTSGDYYQVIFYDNGYSVSAKYFFDTEKYRSKEFDRLFEYSEGLKLLSTSDACAKFEGLSEIKGMKGSEVFKE